LSHQETTDTDRKERPLRYQRTTGLALPQMQELVVRVKRALPEPWEKNVGRPKACGLDQAVEIACMYLRQNSPQEFLGDLRDISQPTVSRIVTKLVPVVKAVLEEFAPDLKEAIEMVEGRVCLVDGTITPCWSYEEHPELWSRKKSTTGFNAQLVSRSYSARVERLLTIWHAWSRRLAAVDTPGGWSGRAGWMTLGSGFLGQCRRVALIL
jgi:Helix-turn-helix of DDE superfamily endonuclease